MKDREIIQQLFQFNTPSNRLLAQYSRSRTGFVENDGYFGLVYPNHEEPECENIPQGYVKVMYFDDEQCSHLILEATYIDYLKEYLVSSGDEAYIGKYM